MARMSDGWIITTEVNGLEVRLHEPKELVLCKNCWKRDMDNCPMELYWDSHPADDDCFCAMGEYKRDEMD